MTINANKNNDNILKQIKSTTTELPMYLKMDQAIDEVSFKTKISKNPHYDQLIMTFFKFDLKGYKSDNAFPNLIDDGLHTFYASHCDYFITNDERCKHKAIAAFQKLSINTKVMAASEFSSHISSKAIGE